MGISTRRYFPANGTAGFARSLVNGKSRLPCPPPMITESTSLVFIDCRPVSDITFRLYVVSVPRPLIARVPAQAQAALRTTVVISRTTRTYPGVAGSGASPAIQKSTQRLRLLANFRTFDFPNRQNRWKLLIQLWQ